MGTAPLLEKIERKRSLRQSRIKESVSRIIDKPPSKDLLEIVANEGRHFAVDRISKIIITFIVLFITLFLMGANLVDDKNWGLTIRILAFVGFVSYCLFSTLLCAKQIRNIHQIKRREEYEFDENDIHFDKSSTILYLVTMCFFAGMLSGTLGIAGGTIMSPLFLSLGMLPSVTAATNQYIGMVSSLSVTLQFMYKGQLNYQYLLFMSLFILISALLGLNQVNRIVKKTGR
jgi:hypothetical protein